jgi:hypothetical protein
MANNKKISQLNPLGTAVVNDLLAIVDVSATETKRITAVDLMTSSLPAEFSAITLAGNQINEFSTDGTLSGDSDTAVPTEKAVKTYVDASVFNAVKLNIIHTGVDSTAVIGDVYLVDATGDVDITLIADGREGKIIVYKNSGSDTVNIIPGGSALLDNSSSPSILTVVSQSLEFVTDGTNFYTI